MIKRKSETSTNQKIASIPIWIKIVSFLFIFPIILSFGTSIGIISWGILLFCGFICWDIASKIKKNKTLAYFIGFLLGIFGLIGYWIYSGIKSKEKIK